LFVLLFKDSAASACHHLLYSRFLHLCQVNLNSVESGITLFIEILYTLFTNTFDRNIAQWILEFFTYFSTIFFKKEKIW
jgi:F0F1-type ATP synthase membrane subunit a